MRGSEGATLNWPRPGKALRGVMLVIFVIWLTFAIGLIAYAPWLILLLGVALIPAFLGEADFNAASYTLNYTRTPERRELDYVRQTGASVETAKEVKIFGLNGFLIERYRRLAEAFYQANRALATRRALWGGILTAIVGLIKNMASPK